MRSVRALLIATGVSLMLVSSASAGGPGVARSSPNRGFASGVILRPEPSVFPKAPDPWRFWPPSSVVHRHGVVPFGHAMIGPSPVIVGSGPVLAVSLPHGIDQTVVVTDGAPSIPAVIEYPTGWYQLRGDGVSTPYVWVWIPRPPPAPVQPPAMVPPVPPPPVASLVPDSPPPTESSARRQRVYRWVDDEGVAHWTDQGESIPQRYRARVERL